MNKIKVLYDMTKAMKEDTKHEGMISLKIKENDEVILTLDGELAKGEGPDEMIHTLNIKGQIADKKIDHESRTVTNINHGHHKGFKKHMGGKCHGHMEGVKENKFGKIMFALDMLNRLEVKELENKRVLSLNLKKADLPEEFSQMMKHKAIHQMMHQHVSAQHEHSDEQRSKFEKYHSMKISDMKITATLSDNNEPEAVTVLLTGVVEEDNITVELNMNRK